MTLLSPHLSEAEFVATSHREVLEDQDRAWAADLVVQESARRLATLVFEPVRDLVGPLHVNSGFRCPTLNQLVGGKPDSRHLLGLAVDVVPLEVGVYEATSRIAAAIRAGHLPDLDKAILEMGRWVHLQAAESGQAARHVALETNDGREFARFA